MPFKNHDFCRFTGDVFQNQKLATFVAEDILGSRRDCRRARRPDIDASELFPNLVLPNHSVQPGVTWL
jgi:hypothetical protein